ncbi:MAG: TPM domain-containing protein [Cytophagales bacterium]|nr:TPM domain-containing protein [Cytophagales bacterium]
MAANFFTEEEKKQIVAAIQEAEKNTSGEIRLHVENNCSTSPMVRAIKLFGKLKMNQTKQHNGVLFYLAVKDRVFTILGDKGINDVVPIYFWDNIKEEIEAKFKEGKFVEGLTQGIIKAGEQLKAHFPYQSDDVNELSDDISFGN